MPKKTYKIPKFRSDAEAAAFWDTHDSAKYISQTKPSHLEFPKPRHKVVIDLGQKQWAALQRLAIKKRVSFNHLLEQLVSTELTSVR